MVKRKLNIAFINDKKVNREKCIELAKRIIRDKLTQNSD